MRTPLLVAARGSRHLAGRCCSIGRSIVRAHAGRWRRWQPDPLGRGDGSYTRLLARLAKLDLLAIDDWMLAPERRDLTEVIADRAERASTLIASRCR